MKFKDRWTIFVKKHSNTSLEEIIIFIIFLIVVLGVLRLYEVYGNTNAEDNYTSTCDDAIFRATFVGDIMMGRSVEQIGKQYGYDALFEKTSYLWEDADYVGGNLESAVLNTVEKYQESDNTIHLYATSQSVVALKDAGFNIVTIANNHVKDYGTKGLINTMNVLNNHDLDYVGAGRTIEDAKKYNVKEINGLKVASIGMSDIIPKAFASTEESSGIFSCKDNDDYIDVIKDAKNNSDIVIVFIHFGEEYSKYVTDRQEELAKNAIDSGADIVIGAHSHTLQYIEKYNDGIIFYSLGNFICDQGYIFTNESALVNFSLESNGEYTFECIPILIEDAIPSVTTSKYHINRIFSTLADDLDEDYYIENDKLIINGNFKIDLEEK